MLFFILRRFVTAVIVCLLATLFVFLGMRLVWHNPYEAKPPWLSEEVYPEVKRYFHHGSPWYVQYAYYVKGVATFDLGPSLSERGRTADDLIVEHGTITLELVGLAMGLALLVGVPFGVLSALHRGSTLDATVSGFAHLGLAAPSFFVGTMLIYLFAIRLHDRTGLPNSGWDGWTSWVLPSIALGLGLTAYVAGLVRAAVLETLRNDYVRTARAKGLSRRRVVAGHVLRNALTPLLKSAGPLLGYLIIAVIVIEYVFRIPGIGRTYYGLVIIHDHSTMLACTVLVAILVIFVNTVADIVLGLLDPPTRDERNGWRRPSGASPPLRSSTGTRSHSR